MNINKKKILVIGAAGYLGSVLVNQLLAAGNEVTGLDNLMFNQNSLFGYCYSSNFKFVKGDVRDNNLLKELIEKNDIVINLAFYVGADICRENPIEATSVARIGIINVLNFIGKDQLLIYPNTNSGYGKMVDNKPCTEESPLTPVSLYGQLKVEVEQRIMNSNVNALIYRLATVCGSSPRMRMDLLVNDFTYKAYKERALVLFEPHFRRNYVNVNDVGRMFTYACQYPGFYLNGETTQIYNLGNDELNCTKLELANKIKEHLPRTEIYISDNGEDPDKRDYLVSSEKLNKLHKSANPKVMSDNCCEFNLDDTIEDLLKCYNMFTLPRMLNI